ncbi:prepilin-type N-terminal cleavage/methylation domain-containing protein [Luteimonas marina]|uniref:Prepilin-type N-terminal cleavage/methylation domain-containing protein n=1 Tax=Luteimonas marina TaxID=488485 RepID=A0A5C5TZ19_9GAMM|nr:prepilin-type N-terminal cleavage/methylation domain-containing protein [Luteimonas marina]TWT18638.1 prepilin-type N-terminal cleavage/methylation domain-containing protein [Luteimonas marina]
MNRQRGYTLLEMVVVIALIALATAMVAPGGYRMIASWSEASEVEGALKSIASLPLRAREEGRDLRFRPDRSDADQVRVFRASGAAGAQGQPPEQDDAGLLGLPEGWSLKFEDPLVVRAGGACSGSRGTLVTTRQSIGIEIEAPFCRVRRLDPDGT